MTVRKSSSIPRPAGTSADEAAPHGSRPEQVYSRLRELIVQAQLAPGSRIIETDVAARLGVSRTPVREALQRLQQEGYVLAAGHSQQSRLTVAPLTRADVRELLYILGAIEGLAAQAAAQLPDAPRADLVAKLEAASAEFQAAAHIDVTGQTELFEADDKFHGLIVAARSGPRLLAMHQAVKPQAERYIRMYISLMVADAGRSSGEHERIIEALRAGEPAAAQHAVEMNWRHAADKLERVIEAAGELGSW